MCARLHWERAERLANWAWGNQEGSLGVGGRGCRERRRVDGRDREECSSLPLPNNYRP